MWWYKLISRGDGGAKENILFVKSIISMPSEDIYHMGGTVEQNTSSNVWQ